MIMASTLAQRENSGRQDCRKNEKWSRRFQQCLKIPREARNCKEDEKYVFSRQECVKAQECKGKQRWSYRYAQCIKLKGSGIEQQQQVEEEEDDVY